MRCPHRPWLLGTPGNLDLHGCSLTTVISYRTTTLLRRYSRHSRMLVVLGCSSVTVLYLGTAAPSMRCPHRPWLLGTPGNLDLHGCSLTTVISYRTTTLLRRYSRHSRMLVVLGCSSVTVLYLGTAAPSMRCSIWIRLLLHYGAPMKCGYSNASVRSSIADDLLSRYST